MKLYNLNAAAAELGGISPWTLRKLIYKGTIAVVHIGNRVLIPEAELDRISKFGLPSLKAVSVTKQEEAFSHAG